MKKFFERYEGRWEECASSNVPAQALLTAAVHGYAIETVPASMVYLIKLPEGATSCFRVWSEVHPDGTGNWIYFAMVESTP